MIQDKNYVEPDDEDEEGEDEEDVSADDIKAIFRFLTPFARPYKLTLLALCGLILLEAGLNFSFPLVTQYLIDEGLIKKEWQALINSLIFMGTAAITVNVSMAKMTAPRVKASEMPIETKMLRSSRTS